jgi:8-oxo-dGTP pyrophosphatase MutT (NUDIX family)
MISMPEHHVDPYRDFCTKHRGPAPHRWINAEIAMARASRRSRDVAVRRQKTNRDVTSAKRSRSRSLGKKRQVAALVFRISDQRRLEFLLITSLGTGRAVIPKGWPMKGFRDYVAAAREAYEEAGIEGKIGHTSIGSYEYLKRLASTFVVVSVDVYPLRAERQQKTWPERGRRELGWFTPEDAASLVNEPALSMLFRQFASRS